jgi:hypothetical protein
MVSVKERRRKVCGRGLDENVDKILVKRFGKGRSRISFGARLWGVKKGCWGREKLIFFGLDLEEGD